MHVVPTVHRRLGKGHAALSFCQTSRGCPSRSGERSTSIRPPCAGRRPALDARREEWRSVARDPRRGSCHGGPFDHHRNPGVGRHRAVRPRLGRGPAAAPFSCPVLTVCHEEGRTWSAPGLIESILCAVEFHADSTRCHRSGSSPGRGQKRTGNGAACRRARPTGRLSSRKPGFPSASLSRLLPSRRPTRGFDSWFPPTASIRVQTRVTAGVAHEEILRVALDEQADVIIMGTRARGPVGRAIFGATCDHVVRGATCPVLTIPPPPGHVERDSRPSTVALASRT